MEFDRIMARELFRMDNRVKIVSGDIGNVSPDVEWIKWLSYEPEFEKQRISYLESKKTELSYDELEEVAKYRRNRTIVNLFKIYGTPECSEDDYMKVYDYMRHESIEKLMLSKLTIEELHYAKKEITRLSKVDKKQLNTKVTEEKKIERYEQLPMVDSYILHVVSEINYIRNINDLDRQIAAQIEQNKTAGQKGLVYASNPYTKR